MGKKKYKSNSKAKQKGKEYIVLAKNLEDYAPFDIRSNKPICYKKNPLESNEGSMVLQEVEEIEFSTRIKGVKNVFSYYAPNNVGLILSVSDKAIIRAKEIFNKSLNPDKFNHLEPIDSLDKKESFIQRSKILYDFIEEIQTSIVFGFTALEAFVNLSIPVNYEYKTAPNNKGIVEVYDKKAIERWTSLRVKLSEILVDIYNTTDITKTKMWNRYLELENMRNQIIHQKSIQDTDFYKAYLQRNIFALCETPTEIFKFFYNAVEEKNTTNPLWPWLIDMKASIPVSYDFNPDDFELIGNIYEGKKKQLVK